MVNPEFAALVLGLMMYTGAFIAEIVRGSIQALPRGQTEAAKAVGLSGYQRLTLIILPQALRQMIPSVTNQFLNVNKNSSLAYAVLYDDLFRVATIVQNKAGHALEMFFVVIITYMLISFLISAVMNFFNARMTAAPGIKGDCAWPRCPSHRKRRIVLPPYRQRTRRPRSVRAREWVWRNLFPSPGGTLLTLVSAGIGGLLLFGILWFVFVDANWQVVTANRWLLFAGSFPHDQEWRLWTAIGVVFTLIGLAYGTWSGLGRKDHLFIALAGGFTVFLMAHGGGADLVIDLVPGRDPAALRRLRRHGADATRTGTDSTVAAA